MANPATQRRLARRDVLRGAAAALLLTTRPAAAIGEYVVSDPFTGVAIGGYDPVAYFLEEMPVRGDPEIEVEWDGAYWIFVNRGNAAAFADAPQVFAPAYGGHGVVGVSRGVPQEGDPTIFAIHRQRLYLFHSLADRTAFLADADALIATADAKWPAVRAMLAP